MCDDACSNKINEHPSLDKMLTFIFYSGLLLAWTLANLIEPRANPNQKSISAGIPSYIYCNFTLSNLNPW